MLFRSLQSPGVVMNRYGVVLRGATILDKEARDRVQAEARRAGWTLSHHPDGDCGRVWQPPAAGNETDNAS